MPRKGPPLSGGMPSHLPGAHSPGGVRRLLRGNSVSLIWVTVCSRPSCSCSSARLPPSTLTALFCRTRRTQADVPERAHRRWPRWKSLRDRLSAAGSCTRDRHARPWASGASCDHTHGSLPFWLWSACQQPLPSPTSGVARLALALALCWPHASESRLALPSGTAWSRFGVCRQLC